MTNSSYNGLFFVGDGSLSPCRVSMPKGDARAQKSTYSDPPSLSVPCFPSGYSPTAQSLQMEELGLSVGRSGQ